MRGKAQQEMKKQPKHNGLMCWKALLECYEPNVGGRHTAVLMAILKPTWEEDMKKGKRSFEEVLSEVTLVGSLRLGKVVHT